MKDWRVKQVFFSGEYQWEQGEHKERGNIVNMVDIFLYSCIKIDETCRNCSKMGEAESKENNGEGKSN
jgi:hypothetical protein